MNTLPTETRMEADGFAGEPTLSDECGACGVRPSVSPSGFCGPCLDAADAEDEPELALGEELGEAVDAAIEALEQLAEAIRRAGGRESGAPMLAHFSAYHLADLEGRHSSAGWLGRGFLIDDLRSLKSGGADGEA